MKIAKFLIVEDDLYLREEYLERYKSAGARAQATNSFEGAKKLLERYKFDYAVLDHDLHGEPKGLELVPLCQARGLTNIAILSSHEEDEELCKEYYALGVKNFYGKSKFLSNFRNLYSSMLLSSNDEYFDALFGQFYITNNMALKNKIKAITRNPLKDSTIFIGGPTGTGKGKLAEFLHKAYSIGGRKGKFVYFKLDDFKGNELHVELFGNKKGAYNNAPERKGRILEAEGWNFIS